jgi:DNA-binding SARP family transcriptional activator
MNTMRVHLFGRFSVESDQEELAGLEAGKVQVLLGYLLINHGRSHSREALASLFWGNHSTTQSRKYLRQTIWQINSTLQSYLDDSETPLISAEQDWVQLNHDLDLWVDAVAFEEICLSVRGTPGDELSSEDIEALHTAVQMYTGDLLEGCYDDWCLLERERLQNMYLALLGKLLRCCETRRDYEAGLVYAQEILSYDRAHERTHRQLMRLYYLAGNRTDALRQFQRCATALREELDVEPARLTMELYEKIRADRLDDAPPAPDLIASNLGLGTATLPEVLTHLKKLQRLLDGIQGELQRDIDAVQGALGRAR